LPHDAQYLDYEQQKQAAEEAQAAETARIYEICNASLRCAIACPIWNRTADDCAVCGNADCIEAKRALDALWKEKDK
jgi:hypothetical protein